MGTEPPFANIVLDWNVPDDMVDLMQLLLLKKNHLNICSKEMAIINKEFMEIMIEGNMNGRGFSTSNNNLFY